MKKWLSLFLALAVLFSVSGCGNTGAPEPSGSLSGAVSELDGQDGEEPASSAPAADDQEDPASRVLVAYFSWADNADLESGMDAVASPSVVSPGNVQQLAGWVQEETGGDLFAIRVVQPYPASWDACLARANQERGEQARPALLEAVENLDEYDTVFLGYPNWLAYHKLIQCTQIA